MQLKQVRCVFNKTPREFFRRLNTVFGKFLDVNKCQFKGRQVLVEYLEEPNFKDLSDKVVEKDLPDEEYIASLYDENDKAGSKVKLFEYAETFGVHLRKGKTFENMVSDLMESV